MSSEKEHPFTMAQTFLIPRHQFVILEVLNFQTRDGRTVLRVLERPGRVLYFLF